MWDNIRSLHELTVSVLLDGNYDLFPLFQSELGKSFTNLKAVLSNKPSDPSKHEQIKTNAVEIENLPPNYPLKSTLIEEGLTISIFFDLNEQLAIKLLVEAEEQLQTHIGFNRGQTAVLLYYESKRYLVNILKILFMMRQGRTWNLDEKMPFHILKYISNFVEKLVQEGCIKYLLDQMDVYSWLKVEPELAKINGLGSIKHRLMLNKTVEEIRLSISECIYDAACQVPLSFEDTMLLMNYIKQNIHGNPTPVDSKEAATQLTKPQVIADDQIFLIMALLYCFDYRTIEAGQERKIEEIDYLKNIKEDYLKDMHKELSKADSTEWHLGGLKALFQFAFQIMISNLNSYLNDAEFASVRLQNIVPELDDDETLINKSIESNVFSFITSSVLSNQRFYSERYFVERVHNLLTDFIYKMPDKIKELRNQTDESIKMASQDDLAANYQLGFNNYGYGHFQSNQGLYNRQQSQLLFNSRYQPSCLTSMTASKNLCHVFEDFLNLIGNFYKSDPLKLELSSNFWSAEADINSRKANMLLKPSQKQISLYKFVRHFFSSGDALTSSQYIAYINMLIGLSTGRESAENCFNLLQSNAHFYDSHNAKISLTHILSALERYYETFKTDISTQHSMMQRMQNSPSIGSMTPTPPVGNITQKELQALISVCKLINQIAAYSERARLLLFEFRLNDQSQKNNSSLFINESASIANSNDKANLLASYNQTFIATLVGLLVCPIPISLKSELMNLLGTFSMSPAIANNMWFILEKSQLLGTLLQPHMVGSFSKYDLRAEIEDMETRDETYPLLRAFLKLILNLISLTTIPDNLGIGIRAKDSQLGFQPYLSYLINSVFLKFYYRPYKFDNQMEKWIIANYILEIFYQLILRCDLDPNEFHKVRRGANANAYGGSSDLNFVNSNIKNTSYHLFYELIQNSPLSQMLFVIFQDATSMLFSFKSKYVPHPDKASASAAAETESDLSAILKLQKTAGLMGEHIRSTSLLCLKLIHTLLDKQAMFIELMKNHVNISEMGLERLVLTINPKTNKAEYFVSILRLIQCDDELEELGSYKYKLRMADGNASLIRHSYLSLSILYQLFTTHTLITNQILNLILCDNPTIEEQFDLLKGFVDHIDKNMCIEDDLFYDEHLFHSAYSAAKFNNVDYLLSFNSIQFNPANSKSESRLQFEVNNRIRALCRLKTLRFILFALKSKQINSGLSQQSIGYFLLGFDIRRPLHSQRFLSAGTKVNFTLTKSNKDNEWETFSIVPKSCLHSMLNIINQAVLRQEDESSLLSRAQPLTQLRDAGSRPKIVCLLRTLEVAYEILNTLCSNQYFNGQFLTYLRENYDFVIGHLNHLPLKQSTADVAYHIQSFKRAYQFSCLVQHMTLNKSPECDVEFAEFKPTSLDDSGDARMKLNFGQADTTVHNESDSNEELELSEIFDGYDNLINVLNDERAIERFFDSDAYQKLAMQSEPLSQLNMNSFNNGKKLSQSKSDFSDLQKRQKIQSFLREFQKEYSFAKLLYFSINAWINNLICLEFHMLLLNRSKLADLNKLVKYLIVDQSTEVVKANKTSILDKSDLRGDKNQFDNMFYFSRQSAKSQANANHTAVFSQEMDSDGPSDLGSLDVCKSKLLTLLDIVDFEYSTPKSLALNFFDSNLIENVLQSFKYESAVISYEAASQKELQFHESDKIYQMLINEINQLSNTNISKSNLIHELNYIIDNIKERNLFHLKFIVMKKYFQSFKKLVECIILVSPVESFQLSVRFNFLSVLINVLLNMILRDSTISESTYPVANLIFTLTTNLRRVLIELGPSRSSDNGVLTKKEFDEHFTTNALQLTGIFKKIVKYLLNSSLTNYKVRTYIYGSIINYLMIFKDLAQESDSDDQVKPQEKRLIGEHLVKQLMMECYDVLYRNQSSMLRIICSDSSDGQNITVMMSLSLLNKLVQSDTHKHKWAQDLNDNGYLACLISAIAKNDNQSLEEWFLSGISNDKIIYLFESKISLLLSIANTPVGAEILLKNNIINALSFSNIFTLRSKFDGLSSIDAGMSFKLNSRSIIDRYYQIFFPTLKLIIAIINSIGVENSDAKSQIARFVYKHSETFSYILKIKVNNTSSLEEIKLVTSLLCKLAPFDELNFKNLNPALEIEINTFFSMLQNDLYSLAFTYLVPDQARRMLKEIDASRNYHGKASNRKLTKADVDIVDIQKSICSIFSKVVAKGFGTRAAHLIFSPLVLEYHAYDNYGSSMINKSSLKCLPISLLINFLKTVTISFDKALELRDDVKSKIQNAGDLGELEIKQFITDFKTFQRLAAGSKKTYLLQEMNSYLNLLKTEISLKREILEKCFFILWRHIEFFCSCVDHSSGRTPHLENPLDVDRKMGLDSSERFMNFNKEELNSLGALLANFLNPNLLQRISVWQETNQSEISKNRDFLTVLIKRIQRLIQLNTY